MARPGVEVVNRASMPNRGPVTDTGQWFVAGFTETGPFDTPTVVHDLAAFDETFGGRVPAEGPLRDAVEVYFREGGVRAIVARVGGAARVEADDDFEAAVDADWIRALNSFTRALGPGQVSLPGVTDPDLLAALLDHAAANNRVAVLDLIDDADAADLIAATGPLQVHANASFGSAWAPEAIAPGLTADTTREVPYSAVEAGLMAKNDRFNTANTPAAGANGEASYILGVKRGWTDADRELLNEAGINVGRDIYGATRSYGYRSLVDPAGPDSQWLSLGNVRLRMQITAEAEVMGEAFMFSQIDGKKQKIAEFAGALTAMLTRFYDAGALFGTTPDDAFVVETGDQVNTPATLADNQLRAVLSLRMSPFAEMVTIEIVKVPITESL